MPPHLQRVALGGKVQLRIQRMQARLPLRPVAGARYLDGAEDRLQLALLGPLARARLALRIHHLCADLRRGLLVKTVLVELA